MSLGSASKSGAVTAVAVVNFVLGGLSIVCGGFMLLGGAAVTSMMGQGGNVPGGEQLPADVPAGMIGGIVMIMAVVIMILGVPMIIAGVGVVKRRQWGRILTLILGAIAGILAVVNLINFNIVGILVDGGYCALVFAILLQKQFAAEFS